MIFMVSPRKSYHFCLIKPILKFITIKKEIPFYIVFLLIYNISKVE
jgi:hypothetical protein